MKWQKGLIAFGLVTLLGCLTIAEEPAPSSSMPSPSPRDQSRRGTNTPANESLNGLINQSISGQSPIEELDPELTGDSASADVIFYSTSDDLEQRRLRVSLNNQIEDRPISFFSLQSDLINGNNEFIRYRGGKIALSTGFPITERLFFDFSLGAAQIVNNFEDDTPESRRYLTVGGAGFYFQAWDHTSFQLRGDEDFLYPEWVDAQMAENQLSARTVSFSVDSFPIERWHYRLESHRSFLNDDNQQDYAETALLYETFLSPVSVWLGVGAGYISFRDATENYWSPEQFVGFGLRSEAYYQFARHYRAELKFNVGRAQEEDNEAGQDTFTEFRLSYIRNRAWNMSVSMGHIESVTESVWNQTNMGLNFNASL